MFAQSFNQNDVLYWIKNDPKVGKAWIMKTFTVIARSEATKQTSTVDWPIKMDERKWKYKSCKGKNLKMTDRADG